MDINLGKRAQEIRGVYYYICTMYVCMLTIRNLLLTDVFGQSGGLVRVFPLQGLIDGERLHHAYVAGQRHGLLHPHKLIPVMQKQRDTQSPCMNTFSTSIVTHQN